MSEEGKKIIKILAIVAGGIAAMTIAGLIFLSLLWHSFIDYLEKALEQPVVCEVEEWEKELLVKEFPDSEETIREGKLYEQHRTLLNEIRVGMTYLEEKYPDYQFKIDYRVEALRFIGYWVTEETTGERFKLVFDKFEGDGLDPEDDFYIYFIEDAYQEYLEEQFMQRSDKVMEVAVNIISTKGKGYDDKITMEDITSGRLNVSPSVDIHISAGDMTEEECTRYVETEMQQAIEEINLSGTYMMYFFPDLGEAGKEGEKIEPVCYKMISWYRKGEK
ncbi:MAG: hypothetical protein NC429_13875 [Lachnospiraceae bacterium]|nr:hypothetical protein [Lachnospiraceae bacterium]